MRLLNNEIDKRIDITLDKSVKSDQTAGVMTYGSDNSYPQKIEKLILGSQTGKACRDIYAKFIAGDGFINPQIGGVVVGVDQKGKNITLDKLRRYVARSIANYNGAYVHVNVNFNGEVGSANNVPFKNIRLSQPDDKGFSPKLGEYSNWAKDSGKFDKKKIVWYPHFNLNEKVIQSNVETYAGGDIDSFRGQIYTLSIDEEYLYPLSPFDSVALDLDTENQVQLYKNRQIRDGFAKKTVMVLNPSEDKQEQDETVEKARAWMGAEGENLIIFEAETREDGELAEGSSFKFDTIDSNIDDKLFENWENSLANSIRKATKALPAILIDYESGTMSAASGEAIVMAQDYYNSITQGDRQAISEMFEEIFSHFANDILKNNKEWRLKPVDYGFASNVRTTE